MTGRYKSIFYLSSSKLTSVFTAGENSQSKESWSSLQLADSKPGITRETKQMIRKERRKKKSLPSLLVLLAVVPYSGCMAACPSVGV